MYTSTHIHTVSDGLMDPSEVELKVHLRLKIIFYLLFLYNHILSIKTYIIT